MRYLNRKEAGQKLAKALSVYEERPDVIVLALPRGGVPVAYEVAKKLSLPLDLMLVRKLGVPGQEELAMGAIADGDVRVLNHDVLRMLPITQSQIEAIAAREKAELVRRSHVYRGDEPPPALVGKTVILIDDGIATGATMRVAVEAARKRRAERVIVAAPVAAATSVSSLRDVADDVIVLLIPEPFYGVGGFYADFAQTTDQEVVALLAQVHPNHAGDNHDRKRA